MGTDAKRSTYTMAKLNKSKVELMQGYVRTEKRESQVLRIVSGKAWVSMEGKDIVLNPGEELLLSHGQHNAVVQPVGDEPLVYEFEDFEN